MPVLYLPLMCVWGKSTPPSRWPCSFLFPRPSGYPSIYPPICPPSPALAHRHLCVARSHFWPSPRVQSAVHRQPSGLSPVLLLSRRAHGLRGRSARSGGKTWTRPKGNRTGYWNGSLFLESLIGTCCWPDSLCLEAEVKSPDCTCAGCTFTPCVSTVTRIEQILKYFPQT